MAKKPTLTQISNAQAQRIHRFENFETFMLLLRLYRLHVLQSESLAWLASEQPRVPDDHNVEVPAASSQPEHLVENQSTPTREYKGRVKRTRKGESLL